MSPEKATIIFRDGWEPMGTIVLTDKEKRESKRNMESRYKSWGIELKLDKLTFLILWWLFDKRAIFNMSSEVTLFVGLLESYSLIPTE